jgi:hypothetical protein
LHPSTASAPASRPGSQKRLGLGAPQNLTAVTDGGHVFSFGFMQTIIRLLAGMTMTNPSAAGPRIIAFRLPYRSAPGLPRAKAFAPSVAKPGCPAGRRFSAGCVPQGISRRVHTRARASGGRFRRGND